MELYIYQLIEYAVRKQWISEPDRIWAANRILSALHMDGFEGLVPTGESELPPLQEILDHLCDYAYEHGVIEGNTATYRDAGLYLPDGRPSGRERPADCYL